MERGISASKKSTKLSFRNIRKQISLFSAQHLVFLYIHNKKRIKIIEAE